MCLLIYIFLDLAVSVILAHDLVAWLANCNTKLVVQLLPDQYHDFNFAGIQDPGTVFLQESNVSMLPGGWCCLW